MKILKWSLLLFCLVVTSAYAASFWSAPEGTITDTTRLPICTTAGCTPESADFLDVKSYVLLGNAATATALQNARTIGNVSFDGTANIVPETTAVVDSSDASSFLLMADSATGNLQAKTDPLFLANPTTGALTATSLNLNAATNQIILDSDGTFTGTITMAALGGNRTYTFPNSSGTIAFTTSNVASATALAANGSNCSSGSAPLGVDASGVSESCFDVWTESENTAAAYAPLASPVFTGIVTLPSAASPTTDADGEIAFDLDAWGSGFDGLEWWNGTASVYGVGITASDTCTNGQVPKFNTGGEWTCEDDDTSAGGAPDDADYLVGTANGTLTNEIVVGTTPGGELGGTWGSPTIDDNLTVTGWALGTIASGVGTALTALDGENIQADTIDDDSIDFADVTLADLTFDVGSVDTTEYGYLNGVTSAIQTQLDTKAVETQTFMLNGFIETPSAKTYRLVVDSAFAGTITETVTDAASGTCTATFNINGTPLGGTANSVSSTEEAQAHASANAVAAGDDVNVVFSSVSACADVVFKIEYTRVLED